MSTFHHLNYFLHRGHVCTIPRKDLINHGKPIASYNQPDTDLLYTKDKGEGVYSEPTLTPTLRRQSPALVGGAFSHQWEREKSVHF